MLIFRKIADNNNNHRLKLNLKGDSIGSDGPIVKSAQGITSDSYSNSELICERYDNWYLHKSSDNDPDHDYFGIEDDYQQEVYNGASNEGMFITHNNSGAIKDWGPSSTSGSSSFSVSLPWGVSYSFDTNSSDSVTTSGSLSGNYATWDVEPAWYSSGLGNTAIFRPGTAWSNSTPVGPYYTSINLDHNATFYCNGQYLKGYLNFSVSYQY